MNRSGFRGGDENPWRVQGCVVDRGTIFFCWENPPPQPGLAVKTSGLQPMTMNIHTNDTHTYYICIYDIYDIYMIYIWYIWYIWYIYIHIMGYYGNQPLRRCLGPYRSQGRFWWWFTVISHVVLVPGSLTNLAFRNHIKVGPEADKKRRFHGGMLFFLVVLPSGYD